MDWNPFKKKPTTSDGSKPRGDILPPSKSALDEALTGKPTVEPSSLLLSLKIGDPDHSDIIEIARIYKANGVDPRSVVTDELTLKVPIEIVKKFLDSIAATVNRNEIRKAGIPLEGI